MGKIISIPTGYNAVGNTSAADIDISTLTDPNINFIKTIKNGQWKSWVKGANGFQGFDKIEKGLGYIFSTAGATTLTSPTDALVDVNTLTIPTGINLLAFSQDALSIPKYGTIPRADVNVIKTLTGGQWKSWSKGTDAVFNGFNSIESTKAYVINVTKTYGKFADKNTDTTTAGVRLSAVPSTAFDVNEPNIGRIIIRNKNYGIKAILKSSYVNIPATPVMMTMFVNAGGTIVELNFPQELLGEKFIFNKVRYSIRNLGSVTVNKTSVYDMGSITVAATSTVNRGGLVNKDYLVDKEYEFTFATGTTSSTPAMPTEAFDDSIINITYDVVSHDNTKPFKVMYVSLGGVVSKISFAQEYATKSFRLMKDYKAYNGVFTENVKTSPAILAEVTN